MVVDTQDVVIISAARTPIGRFLGGLSSFQAPQLGSIALTEALKRAGVSEVDEVIMGNVLQGGLHQNPARQAALGAGLPKSTNAFTVNKVCGSGLKTVALAAQAIKAGDAQIVAAGGFESMSNAPFLVHDYRGKQKLGDATVQPGELDGPLKLVDSLVGDGLWDCYYDCHMGTLAESLEESHDLSREAQDAFALESHSRAVTAAKEGYFDKEIVPVGQGQATVRADEGPRSDTSLEKLGGLKPVFKKEGSVTAGNASTINDGGAALVVASRARAEELGAPILATIESYASAHLDPSKFMVAPTAAVQTLLDKNGRTIEEFDLIELNEAFAIQSLGVIKELGLDRTRLNVNGGAIALGHPIGCSGARILVTLLHSMERLDKQLGLATLCLGGGGAVALSVRR